MKKISLLLFLTFSLTSVFAQVEGTWKLAPQAGAMAVGPAQGDYGWWSNSDADVTTRACLFDDLFVFNADGSFMNVQQTETWVETWQGAAAEGCGTPIAPHDGSNAATWSFDVGAGTVTLTGVGAHVGLAKAVNGSELTASGDAPTSITYPVAVSADGNTITIEMNSGAAWWKFILQRDGVVVEPPVADVSGTWRLAPQAGAMAVGPAAGDYSWWSNSDADVATRACLFDDEFVLNEDGSFMNVQQTETWIETWQGAAAEGCGAAIAPHNGMNAATWAFDETAGTVTLTGVGAHLGLAKVTNGAELAASGDAPASISYPVVISADGNTMTIEIAAGAAFWKFVLTKNEVVVEPPVGDMTGIWKLAPEAGALAVGPAAGDYSWWSNDDAAVATRACLFDDLFVFNEDGSFMNAQQSETWVETWQGAAAEECGTPIAPHNGSNAATWAFDEIAGTVTLTGVGAHLGLSKVTNGAELAAPGDAPASITYPVAFSADGNTITIEIGAGAAFWKFVLIKDEEVVEPPVGELEGTWKLSPQAGALAVGPAAGDYSWWSNDDASIATRACLFDDGFVFNEDGSFNNVQDGSTWVETWQGAAAEECGAPIAPHDGSNAATWTYDEIAGTVTLTGIGAHLGLSKVANGVELTAPGDAPASITYPVAFSADGNTMTIEIAAGAAFWKFILVKDGVIEPPVVDFTGTWILAPEAAALAVGPALGDYSWWSNDDAAVIARACLFDDVFAFNADGSFQNVQQGDTWLEPYQGVAAEECGAPVAPHDGSNAATWAYDEVAGTVTLTGVGAHLGLSKVINGAELTAPGDAPASITYMASVSEDGERMTVEIASAVADGTPDAWRFILIRGGSVPVVEIKEDLFSFYPNPAQSIIQINSAEQMDQYIIRDITGKIILVKSATSLNETIDISRLAKGMYLLESRVDNQVSVKKLIIQ